MPQFYPECSTCGEAFSHKQDLREHLKQSTSCRTVPKSPIQIPESGVQQKNLKTPPASNKKLARNKGKPSHPAAPSSKTTPPQKNPSCKLKDAAPLRVMKNSSPRKSELELSVPSANAGGDSEVVTAEEGLSSVPKSVEKAPSPEIVETSVTKTEIGVDRLAEIIKKAQNVSICFLVDTTGSMTRYINGIKNQIVQIVSDIQEKGCGIAGLAFVGYKDWSDGKSNNFKNAFQN